MPLLERASVLHSFTLTMKSSDFLMGFINRFFSSPRFLHETETHRHGNHLASHASHNHSNLQMAAFALWFCWPESNIQLIFVSSCTCIVFFNFVNCFTFSVCLPVCLSKLDEKCRLSLEQEDQDPWKSKANASSRENSVRSRCLLILFILFSFTSQSWPRMP